MLLDGLIAVVETLSKRIDDHGADLRQKETLTRYALIDPLLRELGWDTSNPDLVRPEYPSGGGRSDYALLGPKGPVVMIEAKKLDESLEDATKQGIQYCIQRGTRYFAVSDGQRWKIYEPHLPVPIERKMVVAFDIKEEPAAETCLKALALWRPSVQAGQVRQGEPPIVGHVPSQQPTPSGPPPQAPLDEGWVPLPELAPGVMPPSEMRFPNGKAEAIKYWFHVLTRTVNWLIENGHLTADRCPVRIGGYSQKYIVHTASTHANGKPFHRPLSAHSLLVEANVSAKNAIEHSQKVIRHSGQDPKRFHLRLPG